MLIYVDKALEGRLSGCTIDAKTIKPMNKDKHNEMREEQKYPCITWFRFDRVYDVTRFVNESQKLKSCDAEGIEIVSIFSPPIPYDIIYQVEIIAKERYDFDMLEFFIDSKINPRGDILPMECFVEELNENKTIRFPIFVRESRQLDDVEDSKNAYYRRVYTLSVKMLLDLGLLSEWAYMIKNEVKVEENN